MSLLRSESIEVCELAHGVLLSAHDSFGPQSRVNMALDNPQDFIQEMRALDQDSNEARGSSDDLPTGGPVNLPGVDPEVFQALPDDILAELLSSLPPESPRQSQIATVDGSRPVSQVEPARVRQAVETVEEVSWPRISEYIQSGIGPRPEVRCVWCQEQVVIPGLQPNNAEREPSLTLPCQHIVGERCLRDSLTRHGVRVTRCPYCRQDIGDVYGE